MRKNQQIETTLSDLFLRFFIGLGSGFMGTLVLVIVLFLTWSIVGDTLSQTIETTNDNTPSLTPQEKTHPMFLSIVTLGFFLATLTANLTFCVVLSNLQERFTIKTNTVITQVFFGNLILLFAILPVYLLASGFYGAQGILLSAVVHTIITGMFTYLTLENYHNHHYMMVAIYGIIVSILFFGLWFCFLFTNFALTVFLIFPLYLSMVGFGTSCNEMIYQWLKGLYGNDFLKRD